VKLDRIVGRSARWLLGRAWHKPTPRAPGPSSKVTVPSAAARADSSGCFCSCHARPAAPTFGVTSVEARAERLRVGLSMLSPEPSRPSEAGAALARHGLARADRDVLAGPSCEDDRHLLNACLEIEAELRVRQWRALERLLGAVPAGDGDWGDRLVALPRRRLSPAILDLMAIGWWHPSVDEEQA
jgi:hypothetical protein